MDIAALASAPLVLAARARLREIDQQVFDEQLRIVAIPAPSHVESRRAAYLEQRFTELGLIEVQRDEVGNVLGRLPTSKTHTQAGAALVTAHLDTVFPLDTELTPRRVGQRVYAPGIADNSRGLAALLGVVRACVELGMRTERPLWFIATVGEEGAGDLYGVKHLLRSSGPFSDATAFVSIDGSGLRRIVHRALGSRRLRIDIRGPGGHSWSDFGRANPVHAASVAVGALSEIVLPSEPRTSLTVARFGGGTTINAIPSHSWFEVDMRSEGAAELESLATQALSVIGGAVTAENERRTPATEELVTTVSVIGDRPSGATPNGDPLLNATVEATRILGAEPQLVASSTDANVAISLGIPAVTIGGGGEAGGIHTLDEWYDNHRGAIGLERSLLVTLAAAGGLATG
ncbi:M20/M25/M40 family metallo-hydrolase [soil metagenome]